MADRLCDLLRDETSATGAVLSLGGNIALFGEKPNGEPWETGVRDPNDPGGDTVVGTARVQGGSLVTSGLYERVFEIVLADGSLPAERRLRVLEELVHMERHTLEMCIRDRALHLEVPRKPAEILRVAAGRAVAPTSGDPSVCLLYTSSARDVAGESF